MPRQRPATSNQIVQTPDDLLRAVKWRLGIEVFDIDLAASEDNTVADEWYDEEMNALSNRPWAGSEHIGGWAWCNPPYTDIAPWVARAVEESNLGYKIAMLVPASTGSNWWRTYVDGRAYITFLNGRPTFKGHKSPYPKDMALLLYAPFLKGGSTIWRWK
jgi:phage N-6-adenine-methyltransferase